ncbi:hypothetical protein SEPCBS119000_004121 [Sporothrix epigloea]|uniref:tRNA(Ile)-lysidine synthetase n=1 Tax=Sporothrix epigloea TaxID=1892477 RepID=A0ABP0DU49_9PEZI
MQPVLHRIAQPIALHEFADALRAAAPPRSSHGIAPISRRVGLAISGGVDSMALAYLCAEARKLNPQLQVADAPISGFTAVVVDHGLREGSTTEAGLVAKALADMGHRAHVCTLKWPGTAPGAAQGSMSSVETTARRLRYQSLGMQLASTRIVSLLLAHHEDDQYETILMRLLSGYGLNGGIRGLRGMRSAVDLPECHGIYGAHQSGLLDEQRRHPSYVALRPGRRQKEHMRREFREEMEAAAAAAAAADLASVPESRDTTADFTSGMRSQNEDMIVDELLRPAGPQPVDLVPIDSEDMGITAYRPLLCFAKDRLVATCLANNVPWFEDHTNADPTLTMRNALRHVVRNHTLPVSLQKPAVLQLAAQCDLQARQHEAEARRLLLRHGVVQRFTANAGTLSVRLPRIQGWTRRRPWRKTTPSCAADGYAAVSREKRRLYLRTIAALAIQKLLSFVTPEANVTPISQLQTVVNTLFPELVSPETLSKETTTSHPKSFIICGVHFMPILQTRCATSGTSAPGPVRSWYLARAPHSAAERVTSSAGASASPLAVWFPGKSIAQRWSKHPEHWAWSSWTRWRLYDGRYWCRTRTRLPTHVVLQPFDRAHSKPFREALANNAQSLFQLDAFLAALKTHAPGKVRYTLPALYVTSDIDWALAGKPYWPDVHAAEADWAARHEERELTVAGDYVGEGGLSEGILAGVGDYCGDYYSNHPPVYRHTGLGRRNDLFLWERHQRTYERAQYQQRAKEASGALQLTRAAELRRPVDRLLALPTLGVHIPGIEDWLQWEVRFRKVDTALLRGE